MQVWLFVSDFLFGVGYFCVYWIDYVCEVDKVEL